MTVKLNELSKYLLAGVMNTAVGYATFLLVFWTTTASAQIANIISYIVGIMVAYVLNKYFVFQQAASQVEWRRVMVFLVCFVVAFSVNQMVLYLFHNIFSWRGEIAQIMAMIAYTVVFYLLNKFIVFKR